MFFQELHESLFASNRQNYRAFSSTNLKSYPGSLSSFVKGVIFPSTIIDSEDPKLGS